MSRMIYTIAVLWLVLHNMGCKSTHNCVPSTAQSYKPDIDARVKIQFGHWENNADAALLPEAGSLSSGFWPVDDEAFCAMIAGETWRNHHVEVFLHVYPASDITVRDFIRRLARLQYLCYKDLAPNARVTIFVTLATSPDATSSTTSPSPSQ